MFLSHKQTFSVKGKNYEKVEALGWGAFGEVHRYRSSDNPAEEIAIKFVRKDRTSPEDTKSYAKLRQIQHANVVKVLDASNQMERTSRMATVTGVVVMEYCTGGDLSHSIEHGVCWTLLVEYARQFLLGLDYLHKVHHIAHTDIKPGNILLTEQHPTGVFCTLKIADVDDVVNLKSNVTRLSDVAYARGTKPYFSPEMWAKINDDSVVVGRKTDIWSFGCVLHQLIYGCATISPEGITQFLQYQEPKDRTLFQQFPLQEWVHGQQKRGFFGPCKKGIFGPVSHQHVEKSLLEVLEKCFGIKPEERPNAKQLLSMPFFNDSPHLADLFESSLLEFVTRDELAYRFNYDRSEPELRVCYDRRYTEFDMANEVDYDEDLTAYFKEDFALTLKLLHLRLPINLEMSFRETLFLWPFKFAALADVITTLSIFYAQTFHNGVLPKLFLPNLVALHLNCCSLYAITRSCLRRYPKLAIFSLHYCIVDVLEDNFLADLSTLKHFEFHPQSICEQDEPRANESEAKNNKYSWLRIYLLEHPDLTGAKSVMLFRKNGVPIAVNVDVVNVESVVHTLNCPRCRKNADKDRKSRIYRALCRS